MGLKYKLLKKQMIPFCFYVPGGDLRYRQFHGEDEPEQRAAPVSKTVKLIKSDGVEEVYDQPVVASEVMSRFPSHLICGSDAFYIGRKTAALSDQDQLQLGRRYFILPEEFFKDNLSFLAIAKLLRPGRPLKVLKDADGCLRISIPEEVEAVDQPSCGLCTTAQLKKDYSVLIGGSRPWKPKLETIRESSKEKKNKRKITYTSSFKFRKPKTHKTSSVDEDPMPRKNPKDQPDSGDVNVQSTDNKKLVETVKAKMKGKVRIRSRRRNCTSD